MTDTDTRTVRVETYPPLGTIFELYEPMAEIKRWIVVGVSTDPNALWKASYDDQGLDPDLTPTSYLLHLRRVR